MEDERNTKDVNGRLVKKGDIVRVLKFNYEFVNNLDEHEKTNINSMMGKEFEVEEVDEYGCAWVTQWWERDSDEKESHSLSLTSSDMEVVENDRR